MATKQNLELNVKAQAKNLDPAQREFVLAELKTYMWNKGKIAKIEKGIDNGDYDLDDEKKVLAERHQLVNENASLFGHIMRWLKGTATEESELDSFISEK